MTVVDIDALISDGSSLLNDAERASPEMRSVLKAKHTHVSISDEEPTADKEACAVIEESAFYQRQDSFEVAAEAEADQPAAVLKLHTEKSNVSSTSIDSRGKRIPRQPAVFSKVHTHKSQHSRHSHSQSLLQLFYYWCKKLGPIRFLFPLCLLSVAWAVTSALSPEAWGANDGPDAPQCAGKGMPICICPRETICANSWRSLVLLFLSRVSAYFDYPLYMILFLSKAHNLRSFLHNTYLSEFLPLNDLQDIHTQAGRIVGIEVASHALWHVIRWALDGDIFLLTGHQTGITGLISLLCTPFIVLPMACDCIRKRISFEVRKALHYLSIVWAASICFHAPKTYIFYLIGVPLAIYLVDYVLGFFMSVYKLRTLKMSRLGGCVEIAWENPSGFMNDGSGYVYICLPWVSKFQWHAFSIMQDCNSPDHSAVCMAIIGDWTEQIYQELHRPSVRPGWVYGPFPSPFSKALKYDNIIAVASGIGITPAISTVITLGERRQVSIIWACREPELLEHYLTNVGFYDNAWIFIFYTGSRPLALEPHVLNRNHQVRIFSQRPNLKKTLTAIVDNIEDGTEFPVELWENTVAMHQQISSYSDIEYLELVFLRALQSYSLGDLYTCACDASGDGDGEVSWSGFQKFVKDFCPRECNFSNEVLEKFFCECDFNDDGVLDEDEFASVFNSECIMQRLHKSSNEPETPQSGTSNRTLGPSGSLEVKKRLDTWTIMYCGGSAPVIADLKKFATRSGIELELESFKW